MLGRVGEAEPARVLRGERLQPGTGEVAEVVAELLGVTEHGPDLLAAGDQPHRWRLVGHVEAGDRAAGAHGVQVGHGGDAVTQQR
ncbi:MAG: hypothetical protein ACR2GH_10615 [Pseudonocardia sp.]